jgi:uncharacterized membrane protein
MTMAGNDVTTKIRDLLGDGLRDIVSALGERAVRGITDRAKGVTDRLTEYAEQGGGPGLVTAVRGAQKLAEGDSPMKAMAKAGVESGGEKVKSLFGGGKGGKGGKGGQTHKVTNIVETIEVGVPVRVAYNQWTAFGDFPTIMKKVEQVEQEDDEKLNWKAQIFWSHRSWESTIIRQIPDRLIHWRSKGEKGSVDGTVSFHEVGPELTRILVVLEYHPQGFFEQTANLWRAQGRRVRLELKHFVRHVMTQTVLDPESVEGWRGEIDDSEVVKDHESALREEQESSEPQAPEGEAGEEPGKRGRERRRPRDEEEPEYEDEDQPEEEEEEEPPQRSKRQPTPPVRRRRPRDEEEPEYEDEEPDDEEPPQRRQTPPVRRRRPREEESGEAQERSRPAKRTTESPRRPVVRRRRQEDSE